jgi:hypothetical protein
MLEICIQTSYNQNVQLMLKSYLPVVYGTPLKAQYTACFTENLFRSLADPNTTFLTTNTTDHHDITEIFLKVVLNTKTLNPFLAKLYNQPNPA